MLDRYKMIIWSKSKVVTLEDQVECSYKILEKLKEYKLCSSFLLPAKNEASVKKFEVTKENIESLILDKRDKKFPNLGSELSFFTSLSGKESFSINFSIGMFNTSLNNTLVISLPINFTIKEYLDCIELLKDLIILYDAYFACIASNLNLRMYENWYDNNNDLPNTVFWINYWGKDIAKRLPIRKIKKNVYECERFYQGYFVQSQDEPIDVMNNLHIEKQKKLNSILDK